MWGACRLCMVEIAGQNRLFSACSTRVAEGMKVTTDSERLRRYRRTIVELLFAERNHVCSVCVSNGHCELQTLAQRCGVDHVRVPYRQAALRGRQLAPNFRLDHNRCVLCTRCVRVCDEIEGAHTWDVMGRGIDCLVITDLDQALGRERDLHGLRQVRAGVPHRRAGEAGHVGRRDGQGPALPADPVAHGGRPNEHDARPERITVATAWLDGCSGCHMSFLDIDERLFELATKVDIVYSPLVDAKVLPEQVDVGILEGSVSTEDDLEKARAFRKRCTLLISLGDCAVNGNVPAMRNQFKLADVMDRAFRENVTTHPLIPVACVPEAAVAGAARARLRAGGRLRAGMPAAGGRDLVRALRADRGPHAGSRDGHPLRRVTCARRARVVEPPRHAPPRTATTP